VKPLESSSAAGNAGTGHTLLDCAAGALASDLCAATGASELVSGRRVPLGSRMHAFRRRLRRLN
jgi:hypothetical protein